MMTVATAALRACVSESLIRQWITEGTLPCFRLGAKGRRGKIVIAEEDLDQVLASFKVSRVIPAKKRSPPGPSAFHYLPKRN